MKRPCGVDGCDRLEDGLCGLCKMHDTRRRRHGSPSVVTLPSERRHAAGSRHGSWTGDQATYNAMHGRLRAARGRARDQVCRCGAPARQWAYDRADPAEVLSPEGYPYSLDVAHYVARCVSCHKRFDLGLLRE